MGQGFSNLNVLAVQLGGLWTRAMHVGVAHVRANFAIFALFLLKSTAFAAPSELSLLPPIVKHVVIRAGQAHHWQQGETDVWWLRDGVQLKQGRSTTNAREAIVWISQSAADIDSPYQVVVYFEGAVSVIDTNESESLDVFQAKNLLQAQTWLTRFYLPAQPTIKANVSHLEPARKPDIYTRGIEVRRQDADASVQRAQFTQPEPESVRAIPGFAAQPTRRLQIVPRGTTGFRINSYPTGRGDETIGVIDGAVNILIDGIQQIDKIDISTDRLVVWTTGDLTSGEVGSEDISDQRRPFELYLEGNVEFRQGDRIVFADSMYYNVRGEYGVVLNAEVIAPVPGQGGLVRLKADLLQQVNANRFLAQKASVTSSRLGVPRYWFQSETVTYQDFRQPRLDDLTGQMVVDHRTGDSLFDRQAQVTSRNNFIYLGGWPIFYWPFLSTDLTKPSYYLDGLSINNDNVFGTQVRTRWDLTQVFGLTDLHDNTEWTADVDFLSERGWGFGTNLRYDREGFYGWPGHNYGFLDAWGIDEQGLDTLGRDRRALLPEEDFRGRILGRHRHWLSAGFQLTAELGYVSDRNFLEQYYEEEWDEEKDQRTGLELKRFYGNQSWSVTTDVQLNEFFTQTEWLPRLDHFLIGQSVFADRLTWHAHSHVGYGRLETATAPTDLNDLAKFDPLAWEMPREGVRAATRQEVSLPLDLGPAKAVPYVLGELAHWQENINGDETTRLLGQVGIRASLPIWRTYSEVHSHLLNVNGLAHKVVFESELFWAEADQELNLFPLYDSLDDDAVEHFRRRFFFDTFGGMVGGDVGLRFDERYYALRTGLQRWVTSPSTEVADDLTAMRLGVHQRFQTKRGLPGQQRTVDWVVLDINGFVYPDADRDNFGQDIGLLDYDFRWHVGDRVTLLSDGFADFFGDGLKMFTVGAHLSRPGRAGFYSGFRAIDGPFQSNVIGSSVIYRLSPKWIASYSSSFDLSDTGNIGQTARVTRVGESFLLSLGFHLDKGRDNVGFRFSIEPRFMPNSRLGRVAGMPLPPVGTFGLE